MKKFFALAAVFTMAVVIFSSCRKDYTCQCNDSSGNQIVVFSGKDTDKNAQASCDQAETMYQSDDPGASCDLK